MPLNKNGQEINLVNLISRRCNISPVALDSCFKVPEFTEKIDELWYNKVPINEVSLLSVMEDVFDAEGFDGHIFNGFYYRPVRKAMRELRSRIEYAQDSDSKTI